MANELLLKKVTMTNGDVYDICDADARARIDALWASKNFDLVPLAKIFSEKWLNKGTKDAEIATEIDSAIAKIKDDIVTIEAIGEDADLLKSLYLDTLNLNSTIQYANTLRANKERAQREAEARAAAQEAKREAEAAAREAAQKAYNAPAPAQVYTAPPAPLAPTSSPVAVQDAPATPEMYVRAFKVVATKEGIIALGNFMNANGIKFEKIELV